MHALALFAMVDPSRFTVSPTAVSFRSLHSRKAVRLSAQALRTVSLQLVTTQYRMQFGDSPGPHGGLFLPVGEVRSRRWHAMSCALARVCTAACTECIGGPGQTLSACNRKRIVELLYAAGRGCCLLYQAMTRLLTLTIRAIAAAFGLSPVHEL
jgi:hypothetical protein